ncbi:MAG: class 1 fructose-bisphosphatase [Nitrospirales bacterium]
MSQTPITLTRYILEEQAAHTEATGEFSLIMSQVSLAARMISADLRRAGLMDLYGITGETNVQGESVQKMDQRANAVFVRAFEYYGGLVRMLISEEIDKPLRVGGPPSGQSKPGKYALYFDPLDGSSNIDVNAVVGSIFSMHRVDDQGGRDAEEALLKPGTDQVAAGYILYGPSTQLVYTRGGGVHLFTLNPSIGEFVLSAKNLKIPARGKVYSTNEGNFHKWTTGTQRYVEYVRQKDPATGRPYSTRYSGCLVADVHRLFSVGGVYMYPAEAAKPEGKLRLMYEAAPMAMIVEQAGGRASSGTERIAEIQPKSVHQRVPLIIGSPDDVRLAEEFVQGRRVE